MKVRHRARIVALQALYEIDIAHHDPGVVLQQRLAYKPLPEAGRDFAHTLVQGILEHQADLDALIQDNAPEWPLDQVAVIDRNILRMAIFEFVVEGNTPVKVAINEAVELAKLFGSDSSGRFVNGVLGAIVSQIGG
ncbi:MAG: transcription antitermination factor NusB [Anaerolineae bacterium]|nr:transcription antitermination factor NusB [Anaerolineae bacterium]